MRFDGRDLAAIFVGGVAGALARAGLLEALPPDVAAGAWPWATFVANVAGAFLLGLVAARPTLQRHLLGTGFCGALTTFSTLQIELLELPAGTAVAYGAASLAAGLAAVQLGRRFA